MSLLEDIRKQPRHIRELMFALSVVITVSMVSVLWFQSFKKAIFVSMNPEPEKQEQFFAENGISNTSLIGNVSGIFKTSWTDLKGSLLSAVGMKATPTPTPEVKNIKTNENVYRLPLPDEK